MNRFKFRVWDIKGKKLYYPDLIAISRVGAVRIDFHTNFLPGNSIIQQFTGLQDKNGKDIYERDIVRFHYFGFDGSETDNFEKGVVEYNNVGFYEVVYSNILKDKVGLLFHETSHFEEPCIEIIGNIFENPNFLLDK